MPIKWTISRADREVTMTAEGPVTLGDVEAYLDALVVADAMPYAKLVDLRGMTVQATDHDMMMLGARMRAYVATLEGGPLAFVVTGPEQGDYVRRYINLTAAPRPVQMFDKVEDARCWLDEQKGRGRPA